MLSSLDAVWMQGNKPILLSRCFLQNIPHSTTAVCLICTTTRHSVAPPAHGNEPALCCELAGAFWLQGSRSLCSKLVRKVPRQDCASRRPCHKSRTMRIRRVPSNACFAGPVPTSNPYLEGAVMPRPRLLTQIGIWVLSSFPVHPWISVPRKGEYPFWQR